MVGPVAGACHSSALTYAERRTHLKFGSVICYHGGRHPPVISLFSLSLTTTLLDREWWVPLIILLVWS